jgi:hypothetical protein
VESDNDESRSGLWQCERSYIIALSDNFPLAESHFSPFCEPSSPSPLLEAPSHQTNSVAEPSHAPYPLVECRFSPFALYLRVSLPLRLSTRRP